MKIRREQGDEAVNEVNRTLYIPLYGKAYVSRKGVILHDPKAEEIWQKEGFQLKGKSRSKWLAYYMGMRSAVFDQWTKERLAEDAASIVLHIGCGMDSRVLRVNEPNTFWYDIDFPDVIAERKKYYAETESYRMIAADIRKKGWLESLPAGRAIVVMEGVSMYLSLNEMQKLLAALTAHFSSVSLLVDCYTVLAAKASRYKNPINDVGVTQVYGVDSPDAYTIGTGLVFDGEHCLTPQNMIGELSGAERHIFRHVFAGGFSRRLYRLYAYRSKKN